MHKPNDLRQEFEELAHESDRFVLGTRRSAIQDDDPRLKKLIGQLWNCDDIMPSMLCGELNLRSGSTYARAVRMIHAGTIGSRE